MEQSAEWFVAITSLVIGASHILRADDWKEVYQRLSAFGKPGAFFNGALSLVIGAFIVAGHRVWAFPQVVLTVFGCLLVTKGLMCFVAPEKALRSMRQGENPSGFVIGGLLLMVIGCWACFCLWRSSSLLH